MPTDSLVYVVIVCIVILTILGTVLLVLKCRKKKAEEPLLPNYM
jgi:hypothetical protein